MSKVAEAVIEIDAALVTFAPDIEGAEDFQRLNITGDAQQSINVLHDADIRRRGLLQAAKIACELLIADGHPTIIKQSVAPAILDSLEEQIRTLQSFLARLNKRAEATDGTLEFGTPVPK